MQDIILVKLQHFAVVLINIIVNFELVNCGNLIRTCYSETKLDYLIIKLVYQYENLSRMNKINPLQFFA